MNLLRRCLRLRIVLGRIGIISPFDVEVVVASRPPIFVRRLNTLSELTP